MEGLCTANWKNDAWCDNNGRYWFIHRNTGNAKTAGNYAGSLKAQEVAGNAGYSQVLWLDGKEKKYIEEVGSMNVFFKINGEVITPVLNGSILDGVTRDSIIRLIEHWNILLFKLAETVEENK